MVLLARPQLHGWSAVLTDVFGTVFVAGVSFLYFALLDSMQARDAAVIERAATASGASEGGYVVTRRDDSRNAERIVSLFIGAALLAVYCALFYDKWALAS